jgi:hypothetical protein
MNYHYGEVSQDSIPLVRDEIDITERCSDHSGERQVPVRVLQPKDIEADVILFRELFCALPVFPDPIVESIFQPLLLPSCGDGFRLIYSGLSSSCSSIPTRQQPNRTPGEGTAVRS